MAILIIEDDSVTGEVIGRALNRAGYRALTAADGERGLERFSTACPKLVILDVMLPGIDGFEVCRRIRTSSQVPIIMLTSHYDEATVMRGFALGVDDYVTKPFSSPLLVARVAGLLRRAAERKKWSREDSIAAGDLELDLSSRQVRKDGRSIQLTPLEFRLFHLLLANPGHVVPYTRLIEHGWGYDGGNRTRLKIRMHELRTKLGLPASGTPAIKAVVGTGYTLQLR
jgi:DNA-binding response OmpR family regulator